ncbi:MAG: hypothetical protein DRP02_09425 [Candidatus Gerdarchaeota archaeon]|nr:MAG: hypothetical protein DRP02_09425 [Candidatus Gerdarchaeota archaeon]
MGARLDDDIFYRIWNATIKSWGSVALFSDQSDGNSNVPTIILDSKEILHAFWFDTTDILNAGTNQDIFYRSYNSTAQEWSNYQVLSSSSNDP